MSASSISEINHSILFGSFTNEQLNSIADAIKFARAQLASKNVFTLRVGATVKFKGRQGATIVGTVEKVNRKFIHVRENQSGRLTSGIWRVPANMLEAA